MLVFKTSSRRLQDMSWRRLQHVFSVTFFRLPRHLEDILQNVLKTSWRRLQGVLGDEKLVFILTIGLLYIRWRRLEDVLKTSWRHVLKMSWRHILKTSWRYVLKTSSRRLGINKSKCVYLWSNNSTFNKSISDKSKANRNALIRT